MEPFPIVTFNFGGWLVALKSKPNRNDLFGGEGKERKGKAMQGKVDGIYFIFLNFKSILYLKFEFKPSVSNG